MGAYNTVTPCLVVDDGNTLIEFLANAFDGKTRCKFTRNDGSVMHAEIVIGEQLCHRVLALGRLVVVSVLYVGEDESVECPKSVFRSRGFGPGRLLKKGHNFRLNSELVKQFIPYELDECLDISDCRQHSQE